MRAITKGKEPASLAEHRANPGADYETYAGAFSHRVSVATTAAR